MHYKALVSISRLFGCLSIVFDRLGDACFRIEEWAIARARYHKHTCTVMARPNMRRY